MVSRCLHQAPLRKLPAREHQKQMPNASGREKKGTIDEHPCSAPKVARCWRNSVMRKVIVLEFITLDGVIQAGGGPEEDTSGGFAYGGWQAPYSDDVIGTVMNRQMNMPFDLLLGRKTFEIWAPYWPHHADIWPGVNPATKYVASNTMTFSEWQPSVFLS